MSAWIDKKCVVTLEGLTTPVTNVNVKQTADHCNLSRFVSPCPSAPLRTRAVGESIEAWGEIHIEKDKRRIMSTVVKLIEPEISTD